MATSSIFFKNVEQKIVNEDLFSKTAEEEAKKFLKSVSTDNRGNKRGDKDTPTSTQIRRFFNDILSIKQKIEIAPLEQKNTVFKKQLPYIKMIKAKVVYAKSRDHVNYDYEKFMNKYIDNIKDIDDFFVFCDFFESIIAYSKMIYK